jgi:hypothetical protein
MKFLTGEENKEMIEAHLTGLMILGSHFELYTLMNFMILRLQALCIKLQRFFRQYRNKD